MDSFLGYWVGLPRGETSLSSPRRSSRKLGFWKKGARERKRQGERGNETERQGERESGGECGRERTRQRKKESEKVYVCIYVWHLSLATYPS